MSEATTDLAPIEPRKAITVTVAERYGMEADAFELALRNTVFLEGSRAEYAAFLVVCNEYKLNPLTKEIYAFKNKQTGKIVPVVSVDGWVTLCNGHPQFDGMTFEDNHDADSALNSITCTIYRKDRSRPTQVTEYLSECIRDTAPWKMKHRMLRHKALQQCARYAFGFSGIYDEDEAEVLTIVSDTPVAPLTAGFGADKPARRARKPKDEPASDQPGEPEEGLHASAEPAGGGEFEQDAVFEDITDCEHTFETDADGDVVCSKCGLVPDDDEVSDAEGLEGASVAQAALDAEPAAADEPEEEKTTAPAGEVYLLAGDAFNAEGKRTTYKDGVRFGAVSEKAAAKLTIHDFHAPEVDPPAGEVPGGDVAGDDFPGDRTDAPSEDGGPFKSAFERIAVAPGYLAAKQAMTTLKTTDVYATSTPDQKTGVRLAIWKRYVELCDAKVENGEVWIDFNLMRLYLEFGATSEKQVDEMWAKFDRHDAFKRTSEADQGAMSKLMLQTKARLRDG